MYQTFSLEPENWTIEKHLRAEMTGADKNLRWHSHYNSCRSIRVILACNPDAYIHQDSTKNISIADSITEEVNKNGKGCGETSKLSE